MRMQLLMKNKIKKVLSVVIISLLVLGVGTVPAHATPISDLEKQKEELEKEKEEAKKKKSEEQSNLDKANSKASSIAGNMEGIESEMEETDQILIETIAAIDIAKEEIAAMELKIAATELKYEEAKKTEEDQYEAMKLRIRYMYEKGDVTYMQLLIEAQGFSDMMNKVEYIEKLYDYDRKLLIKYTEAKDETLRVKNELELEKEELDESLGQLEEEEAYYNELLAKMQEQYESYEGQLAQAKAEAAAFKANVDKQNAEIKKLDSAAKAKQKEIDDVKKAEEEARAAEAAAAAAVRAGNSMSSSGSSDKAPSSSSKSYSSAASFGSGSKGKDIANYALQFVGNPYVPGGTSLTEGCDCSGFVMRVYKDFGYSLPRTSTSMRSSGYEVSYESAQPGDIVCYAGHVALYIGNGQIVHASTPSTGIKTGNIFYKPFITIRRIV